MESVQIILLLVGLATVVAVFARHIAVPAPSLLVVAGLLIGFVPGVPELHITPEIISLVVLPPLLYAAGEELSWPQLRRSWKPVAVLAIGLVPVSAAAVALVTVATTPVPWVLAFLLGAVLSSTDPVAVTALGRKLALPQRLQTLVQAESLFNDATSLILFRVSAAIAVSAAAVTWLQLPSLIRSQSAAGQPWVLPVLLIVVTLVIVRMAWTFPLAAFQQWRHVGTDRPMWQVPAVLSWAGARGVVPLAAALSIPEGVAYRDLLLLLAVGVTVVSLVVQGFTLGPLVRRVQLAVPREDVAQEYRAAWARLVAVGQEHLDELEGLQAIAPVVIERARQSLRGLSEAGEGEHLTTAYAQLRQSLVLLQGKELMVLYRSGQVTESTRRRVQRDLDLDAARYSDDH